MRVLIVWATRVEVHRGHVAIGHVRSESIVARVCCLSLDGIAEVCHGRECHGHCGGCHVIGIGIGGCDGRVVLRGAVGMKEDLIGSGIGRVGKLRRAV
jgi:hypothetical protein